MPLPLLAALGAGIARFAPMILSSLPLLMDSLRAAGSSPTPEAMEGVASARDQLVAKLVAKGMPQAEATQALNGLLKQAMEAAPQEKAPGLGELAADASMLIPGGKLLGMLGKGMKGGKAVAGVEKGVVKSLPNDVDDVAVKTAQRLTPQDMAELSGMKPRGLGLPAPTDIVTGARSSNRAVQGMPPAPEMSPLMARSPQAPPNMGGTRESMIPTDQFQDLGGEGAMPDMDLMAQIAMRRLGRVSPMAGMARGGMMGLPAPG